MAVYTFDAGVFGAAGIFCLSCTYDGTPSISVGNVTMTSIGGNWDGCYMSYGYGGFTISATGGELIQSITVYGSYMSAIPDPGMTDPGMTDPGMMDPGMMVSPMAQWDYENAWQWDGTQLSTLTGLSTDSFQLKAEGNVYTIVVETTGGGTPDPVAGSSVQLYSGTELVSQASVMSGVAVSGDGSMLVSSGGMAEATILDGGAMTVFTGGTASSTSVDNWGSMFVSSGGKIEGAVVSNGTIDVSSGGTATDLTVSAGAFFNFAVTENTYIQGTYDGDAFEIKNAKFSGCAVRNGCCLEILSGGTADCVSATNGGYLHVSNGGTVNNTTLDNGAWIDTYSGGFVNSTTVNSEGTLIVFADGAVNNTTVNEGGLLQVFNDAEADNTVVCSGGSLFVSSGAVISGSLQIASGAAVSAYQGAIIDFTVAEQADSRVALINDLSLISGGNNAVYTLTVSADQADGAYLLAGNADDFNASISIKDTEGQALGTLTIGSFFESGEKTYSLSFSNQNLLFTIASDSPAGGSSVQLYCANELVSQADVMSDERVYMGCQMLIAYGGTANRTIINGFDDCPIDMGGRVYVSAGGTAIDSVVEEAGWLIVGGGTASHTAVFGSNIKSGGFLVALNGGKAEDTVLNGGALLAYNRGVADSTTVNSGGAVIISGGGTASNTIVNSGFLMVSAGGTAVNTSNCGYTFVLGGTADDTTIGDGGMMVSAGGTANRTVLSGGSVVIEDDGIIKNTIISGGSMNVSTGGIVSGTLQITSGAMVSAYQGAIIDFTVAEQADSSTALINDWSLISGGADAIYTITVNVEQVVGTYVLAGGAAGFANTITVKTVDNTELGTLAVGETKEFGGVGYTLTKNEGSLELIVGAVVTAAAKGDLDGNGLADVVMTIDQSTHPYNGATGAWLIQEDQTPVWGDLSTRNEGWSIFGTGWTSAKANADVYIKSTGNIVGAWVTDAQGKVSGWETIGDFGADAQVLGLGDFNGDGQSDVLLRNTNGAVGCYFTNGDGWNYFQSLGDEWKICGIGDLNGDGLDDVVLKHDAGFAGTWLTQTDGTIAWADLDTLSTGFEIVGCGDFNGDGVDDVLLQNGSYFGAWIVENGSVSGWMGLGTAAGTVEQIADFNGDGTDDLRVRSSDGAIGSLLVKGADTLDWKYYGSVGDEWSTSLAAL